MTTFNNIPLTPFKDFALSEAFHKTGFIHIQQILNKELDNLIELSIGLVKNEKNGFQYSLMENSFSKNECLQKSVLNVLNPILNAIFSNFKTFSVCLLTKSKITNFEMELHQDWTFTNEMLFAPCTVWVPLSDVGIDNGTLFFIPKSHLFFDNFRSIDYPTARIHSGFLKDNICTVEAKKGDIIIFHPGILHGSFPNNTKYNRTVISFTVLAEKAPFIHVKKLNDSFSRINHLDEQAFLSDLSQIDEKYLFESEKYELKKYQHVIPSLSDIKFKIQQFEKFKTNKNRFDHL